MNRRSVICYLIIATFLLALVPTAAAEDTQSPTVIYQTTFSTDPRWVTNNPSSDYWDSNLGMYHFGIEPSTGNYAYIPVDYERGPFKLEYDVIFNQVDEGATFRLGFSGQDMEPTKGPMVLTQFTNAKFGQIMWLRLVTNSNKMVEVNSQNSDSLSSGANAYEGPTVKYEINKTYHVTVNYDEENALLSMKVNEKTSGSDVWSYFVNAAEDLHGMDRIFLGSKGDYGMMGIYAKGYIDNVRLTVPVSTVATPTATVQKTTITTRPTPIPTTANPIGTVPTEYAETTQQSPSSVILPIAAFSLVGLCLGFFGLKRRE
ncbi:MAG: hypothetical protein M0Q92_07015 [Methanoregula sp.]|jgi:hypothetical protein|nr:hypothetical protein [Methanoregula sp.]